MLTEECDLCRVQHLQFLQKTGIVPQAKRNRENRSADFVPQQLPLNRRANSGFTTKL
jgi:hypothetical protein